jgi:proteasome lid subunit RPN8/RPN11
MAAALTFNPVRLPASIAEAIRTHARQTYPNECCGILFGTDTDDARLFTESHPVENAFAETQRHHRFTITPVTLLHAEKHAAAKGLAVLGFYHSHPDHPAEPSEYDRTHAWPFYSYIIVSVEKGSSTHLSSWQLHPDTQQFHREDVRVS